LKSSPKKLSESIDGIRSLFSLLKQAKRVFLYPKYSIRYQQAEGPIPTPSQAAQAAQAAVLTGAVLFAGDSQANR
jgi:hypothetical protein